MYLAIRRARTRNLPSGFQWSARHSRDSVVCLLSAFGELGCRGHGCSRNRVIFLYKKGFVMGDYSSAILALIAVTAVLTTGVVYVLAQPTDVPVAKREGWSNVDIPFPDRFCCRICLPPCSGISHDDSRFQHERSCFIVSASGSYRPTHDSSRASWSKRRHHVWRLACCQIPRTWWVWSYTCLITVYSDRLPAPWVQADSLPIDLI